MTGKRSIPWRCSTRWIDEFFHQVEAGRWPTRDPRSVTDKIL
jgi:hypothetical protein